MNYLELCQAVARESGTIAGLPSFTTVAGATGRLAKLTAWVADAWRNIQNERTDWLFLRQEFSKALIVDQTQYTPASFGLEVLKWMPDTRTRRIMSVYDNSIGQADEGHIQQIPYDRWRAMYNHGSHDANRPTVWAQAPDKQLCVGPKPDKAYIIRGEYIRTAQLLTADADIPIIPTQFHGVIVGEALRLMARADEALQVLAEKAQQYDILRTPLVNDQTADLHEMWAGPLG